jgi:DNA-binding SARP family transcriptional activator
LLEFKILGPVEVLRDGDPIRLGGTKQRATLAILLLGANRVVSVERLADDLYAGAPPVTAVTQVQRQVSELRKLLGTQVIETRSPGYLVHVEPGLLDLERFERWTHEAAQSLERTDPGAASDLLSQALALWRGAPLADLTYETFAQTAIARLDELRLGALEQRFTAELELGRHAPVLPELSALVWDHPLRERLRGLLMVALYRDGRQTEALDAYRKTREVLVAEFGLEPSPFLQRLEQQILRQDPSLDRPRSSPALAEPERALLVVPASDNRVDDLLSVAKPLAALPGRVLIVARLLAEEPELGPAVAAVTAGCSSFGSAARAAAFTSLEPARDVVRLATTYDVELVLIETDAADMTAVIKHSPADVALFSGPALDWASGSGVFVVFGGSRNDWAALEVGAWLASSAAAPLRLVGTAADPSRGRRDASRLLADASLAVQRVVGVAAEPLLAESHNEALLAAVAPATVVVAALPARDGRRTLADSVASAPVLLVHRGTRPGGLAPRDSWTRFSWSLEG